MDKALFNITTIKRDMTNFKDRVMIYLIFEMCLAKVGYGF